MTTFITSVGLLIANSSASGARSSGNSWLISLRARVRVALHGATASPNSSPPQQHDAEDVELLLGQAPTRIVTSSPDMPTFATRPR